MVVEDDGPVEMASATSSLRNLAAWRVTIPYIDLHDDEAKRERVPVFCIDVERNDRKDGEETDPPPPPGDPTCQPSPSSWRPYLLWPPGGAVIQWKLLTCTTTFVGLFCSGNIDLIHEKRLNE